MIRPGYTIATLLLFEVEVCIALFVRDAFVRPYLGDLLAVILVYCGLRAVTRIGVGAAVGVALAIAFAVEFGQLIHILDRLGIENQMVRMVLGTGFEVKDLFAYSAGGALVLLIERLR